MADQKGPEVIIGEIPRSQSKRQTLYSAFWLLGGVCLFAFWISPQWLGGSRLSTDHVGSKTIDWKPCFDDPDVQCATVRVPTNHSDPDGANTFLSLAKIPFDNSIGTRLGSVYTNFGGPGASGRDMCFEYGRRIHSLVGGRFDIICWDPRGIGRTTPNVNCYGSAREQRAVIGGSVLEKTFEVPPNPTSPAGKEVLIHQQKQALNLMQLQAGVCGDALGAETLKWMGTTTLIRDMEYMKNVIDGEDALINFHGGSYGTEVAEYLANMLPDKVGAVVAHGVATPIKWATEHYENYSLMGDLLQDSEKSYRRFLQLCHEAGPRHCFAASTSDTSGDDIYNRIERYLTHLYETGGVPAYGAKKGILTSGMVRQILFTALQVPELWRSVMGALAIAMASDPQPLFDLVAFDVELQPRQPAPDGYIAPGQGSLARLAVSCADSPPYDDDEPWPTAEEMVNNLLKKSFNVTKTFGLTVNLMEQHGGCQFWPRSPNPVERFQGPFNSTLRTPMLVVSNSHDPITPASAGRQMAEKYGRHARHVVQDGIGHSYLIEPTECYAKLVKAYFETGKLPDESETYCDRTSSSNLFEEGTSMDQEIIRAALRRTQLWGV
nr:uncharacterized protein CI109_002990 [Kwoniella shandongensis]KAA5528458.1 hypothetical protein CI109_002990 [Kwoniella shandongensis]